MMSYSASTGGIYHRFYLEVRITLILFGLAVACMACGQDAGAEQSQNPVTSVLEGQVTLNTAIDSIPDFSGFEVIVAENNQGVLDTLAYALTDTAGYFSMQVPAPRADIFTLIISRGGSILLYNDIVIADHDSASFKVQLPIGNRPLMIRSRENAALIGFKNTMALHNSEMNKLAQEGVNDRSVYAKRIAQTVEILWNLQNNSPNTLAAGLGAAQSILMLDGWNDSLLVARALELDPENPNYGSIVGAARRARIRQDGLEAGPTLVLEMKDKVTDPAMLAMVQSELVLAYRDNRQIEEALDAARQLKMDYATDSTWIRWADRAIYDLENLMPGMPAPAFSLIDVEGRTVSLESFAGQFLVLEFYNPGPDFERQLTARNAFYRADKEGASFEILSISLQPDSLLNEAFFEGRDIPGRHVFLADGPEAEVVKKYNVYLLPTRFVIGPDGNLVGKYVLENGSNAFQDALTLSLSASN